MSETLKDIGLYVLGALFGLLALALVAGLFGVLFGLALRVAKWVAGL